MGFVSSMFVMVVTVMVVTVVMVTVVEGMPQDAQQPVSYSGWKVLQVRIGEAPKEAVPGSPKIDLNDLDDGSSVNILVQNRQTGVAEVAVSPSALPGFAAHLSQHQIPFSTFIEDLGRQIKAAEPNLRAEADLSGGVTFTRYMSYDEITAYVKGLQASHPNKVKVETAGNSVDNRPIHILTITDNVDRAKTVRKPVVFIDGGIHAREWISPAATLGVIDNLLKTPIMTQELEWRIIPLVNPDGYVASWEKDRLWRKNNAKNTGNIRCSGVDLNRNFGYQWGVTGSSGSECSTVYRGPTAFSEPEAVAVRDAILLEADRTKAYITFHSYGQLILHPWGYSTDAIPDNYNKLEQVGKGMANAIKMNNQKTYKVMSAADLYPAAGGSDDWAAAVANIPLSFTIELRDTGTSGFLLPPSQIKDTVLDAWLAMKYLGQSIMAEVPGRQPNIPFRQADSQDTQVTQVEGVDIQSPSHVHQEPKDENIGFQSEGVEVIPDNQGETQVLETRRQEPEINQQLLRGADKVTEDTSEMEEEEEEDISQHPSRSEDQDSSHQSSFDTSFTSQVRDASEPLNEESQTEDTQGSSQHASGGSVLLKILRGDEVTSIEEGGESESSE